MKANELMIGDWVRIKSDINSDDAYWMHDNMRPGQALKVEEILSNGINPDWYGGEINDYIPEDALIPIPLTPEILEKNGWKREFDKAEYMVKYDLAQEGKNCWLMWAVKEHNLDLQRQDEKLDMYNLKVQRVCMPCDFVHELQHALRLCGINKTIEL